MAHHGLIITVIISPCGALLLVARVACILAFSSVRQFLGLLDMMSNLGRLATEPTDRMLLIMMLAASLLGWRQHVLSERGQRNRRRRCLAGHGGMRDDRNGPPAIGAS